MAFVAGRRPATLFPLIRAVRSATNHHDVAFASVFGWQAFEVSDLEFDQRQVVDWAQFLEALQPLQQSRLHW